MDYQSLYDPTMKISPAIRYATITDMNGKIKQSGPRKGVTNLLPSTESLKSLKLSAACGKHEMNFQTRLEMENMHLLNIQR